MDGNTYMKKKDKGIVATTVQRLHQYEDDHKVWRAGKAPQEELDDIDQCNLCHIMPELEKTCYATKYCHRQMRMDI